MNSRKPFLTAEWRHLAMLNYPVDREVLAPYVPAGTVLDTYQGVAYLSLVGFLFLKTKLLGVAIPFHQDFEEVNLRFYVRRLADDGWRRGVVFIKEIVPKLAISAVARICYNEKYVMLPMRHRVDPPLEDRSGFVEYGWKSGGRWEQLQLKTQGSPLRPGPGSLEEFITEHYWGYTAQKDGSCLEYQVEHLPWRIWRAAEATFECDAGALYGDAFRIPLAGKPASAFLAEGSPVTVHAGAPARAARWDL